MIDLRSDTVSKPSPAMRAAMAEAQVGDDVYGEDPTVNKLQSVAATLTGMEAAIFVSSGTQSNLLALLSHCQRGDEYIAGQDAHTYRFEGGGAAVLGSIQPQPIEFNAKGELDLERVRQAIKPRDFHFARTRLLCLENTQSGKVLSLDYTRRAAEFARRQELRLHLDGARVFNAAIQQQVPVERVVSPFDSVSLCLSKGLGAPVGSILCGSDELIDSARRWRKVLGGGMRQAGILAAAGIFALQHNLDRLAEDHHNAARLAEGLADITGFEVDPSVDTNMVFFSPPEGQMAALQAHLKARDILISGARLVTHLDISARDIETAIDAFAAF
ncbi:MAG: low-specificity L-threonine aldolase [Pseudomonadales bacterium]|nr:low-specificity L-threonine aldolase [Pseudomonadales bacterium]MDP7357691.1 low-specificity L-threonine aldolase [Pseudomonadales bacterium]MDP7597140.1 low-specificity L-threonine aldolase [Pseudomonadales bacterium]